MAISIPVKHAFGTLTKFQTLIEDNSLEQGKLYFVLNSDNESYSIHRAISTSTAVPVTVNLHRKPLNNGASSHIEQGDTLVGAFGKVQSRISALEKNTSTMFNIKGEILATEELAEDGSLISYAITIYQNNNTFTLDFLPTDETTPSVTVGDAYRVTKAGPYIAYGGDTYDCQIGDWLVKSTAENEWAVVQGNIDIEGLKDEINESINAILADYEFTDIKAVNIDALDYETGDIGWNFPFQNIQAHNFILRFVINGEDSFYNLSDILNLLIKEKVSRDEFYNFFFPNRKPMSLWGWVISESFYSFGRYQDPETLDDVWMSGASILNGDYFIVEEDGVFYAGYEDSNQYTVEFSCKKGDMLRCISEGAVTSTGYSKEPRFEYISKENAPRYINNIKTHAITVSETASDSTIGEKDAPFTKIYAEEVYVGKEDEQLAVKDSIEHINSIISWEAF